jgi:hypothetical protein
MDWIHVNVVEHDDKRGLEKKQKINENSVFRLIWGVKSHFNDLSMKVPNDEHVHISIDGLKCD